MFRFFIAFFYCYEFERAMYLLYCANIKTFKKHIKPIDIVGKW